VAVAWLGSGADGRAEVNPVGVAPKVRPASRQAQELRAKLDVPITVEFEPGPLKELLAFLQDRHGIPIIVDEDAFKTDEQLIDVKGQQVKLDKVVGVKLRTVLHLVLVQVNGDFLVRDGMVVVVPRNQLLPPVLLQHRVDAVFVKETLADALQELSDVSGATVVIDTRAGEQAKAVVTANLMRVPLETAVRVLADMGGLKAVALENVLYVTTPDNAERLPGGPRPMPRADEKPAAPPVKPAAPAGSGM
jgi:hypothetical protein